MSTKIKLVNTDFSDDISILKNEENSYIVTNNSDEYSSSLDYIVTESQTSLDRPLHCSEFNNKLVGRNFNRSNLVALGGAETDVWDVYLVNYKDENITKGIIDEINDKVSKDFSLTTSYFPEESEINTINKFYTDLFGGMEIEKEVDLYNSSKKIIDIVDDVISFDLIKYSSDIYTDTINLNELSNFSHTTGISGKLSLNIQYTKRNIDSIRGIESNSIYSINREIFAFDVNDSGELTFNNLIEHINSDISVEVVNGILKICSLTDYVDECIINSCFITYGK